MKVSVIIPVYNIENFIAVCIESLLAQIYDDFEIIIVNDGSTDGSFDVCKKYQKKDARIKLISQDNSGVSVARNIGIENAAGDYIMFVDGDDIVSPKILSSLVSTIEEKDVIFSMCGAVRINKYDFTLLTESDKCDIITTEKCLIDILNNNFEISVWGKLFHREKIAALRFITGKKINEDKYFLFQYIIKNKGYICIQNNNLYGYYIRDMSSSRKPFSKANLDILYFADRILEDIKYEFTELCPYAYYNQLTARLAILKRIIRFGQYNDENVIFDMVKKDIIESGIPPNIQIPLIRKMEFITLKIHNYIFIACVRIFDKIKLNFIIL